MQRKKSDNRRDKIGNRAIRNDKLTAIVYMFINLSPALFVNVSKAFKLQRDVRDNGLCRASQLLKLLKKKFKK